VRKHVHTDLRPDEYYCWHYEYLRSEDYRLTGQRPIKAVLDYKESTLTVGEDVYKLSPYRREVLRILAKAPTGKPVPVEDLVLSKKSVQPVVSRLRQKIGDYIVSNVTWNKRLYYRLSHKIEIEVVNE